MNKSIKKPGDYLLDGIIRDLTSERDLYMSKSGDQMWVGRLRDMANKSFISIFGVAPAKAASLIATTEAQGGNGELALSELVAWQRLIVQSGKLKEARDLLREKK